MIKQIVHYRDFLKNRYVALDEDGKHKVVGTIYIILTLFTVAFFGVFAIQPTLSTISSLHRQYEDNQTVYDQLKTKSEALLALRQEHTAKIQPSEELLYQAIPKSPQVPIFVRKLETLANDNNISISNLSTGTVEVFPAAKKPLPFYIFVFTIGGKGGKENIKNFINAVATFDRVMIVDQVTLKQNETDLEVIISGKIFFNKDK